jgi:hypothetical protein
LIAPIGKDGIQVPVIAQRLRVLGTEQGTRVARVAARVVEDLAIGGCRNALGALDMGRLERQASARKLGEQIVMALVVQTIGDAVVRRRIVELGETQVLAAAALGGRG